MKAQRFVALLRAVNVAGANKLPMAQLRQAAAQLGWHDPATYIQSGNLVFTAAGSGAALEQTLTAALKTEFGLSVPVLVRTRAQWTSYANSNPFAEVAGQEPNRVMLALCQKKPASGAAAALQARGIAGERVLASGDALYAYYPEGMGRSKLTPALFDRTVGSPVTQRNWNTVMKLQEMLNGA